MLVNVTPAAETSLKARYRILLTQLKEKREEEKQLANTSGLSELKLVEQFGSLQKRALKIENEAALTQVVQMWRDLSGQYAQQEFYPWDLSNHPKVQEGLTALLKRANPASLASQVDALEKAYAPPMYVLLDDEKPTDNPWILFVYIAVPLMLLINFRKLLRFILDWRQHGL